MVCVNILSLLISSIYIYKARNVTINSFNFSYWKIRLNIIGLFRGVLWGSIAITFYIPDQLELQVFLFVVLLLVATLMAFISATEKPVFFAVTVPVLAPIAIQFALNGDDLHATFAISVVFYFIIILCKIT